MSSYDDDLPTQQEEFVVQKLTNSIEQQERIDALIQLKNLVIGSKRCKVAFYHIGTLDILHNLLKEYSTSLNIDIIIQIIDCISSFAKSNNTNVINRLIELGFIEQLINLLSLNKIDSKCFYESCFRCLRSFFIPKIFVNPYVTPIPFIILNDRTKDDIDSTILSQSNETYRPIDILFENSQILDVFYEFLSISKSIQTSILEILCSSCINKHRQQIIVDKNFIQPVMHLIVENTVLNTKTNLVSPTNEYFIGLCLKFFCSLCYENTSIAERLHATISIDTNQTLCEIVSHFLHEINRPVIISYYASKFFVNLCKSKVLSCENPYVSYDSLTTLIHLCTKSILNKSLYLHLECFKTLIYLLDDNHFLHYKTIYTEQFLKKLFYYVFTPSKILDENIDEAVIIEIRAAALTLLAVLSSYHEDIKKRIADQESLITTAIEWYRSPHASMRLASLRLFHGLSRSVQQLRTTFNDTICDILLDAIKSSDLSIIKRASFVISNGVLEFSTCRPKLLSSGIINLLIQFLNHTDHDLSINSIWALRNLSYLAAFPIKQEIINNLTIDRIYSLFEQSKDEQFLLCLLSLVRNLLDEKDVETFLPMFDSEKLLDTLKKLLEKPFSKEIDFEIKFLIDYINSTINPSQQKMISDLITSTCRISNISESTCDELDQLDFS